MFEYISIGDLSKHSGVNIETIRYYERVEVLAPPPRTAGGRRVYGSKDLRILVFIRRSRELGFSLDEIRTLLRLGGPEKASCGPHHVAVEPRVGQGPLLPATQNGHPIH